jgi:hypothetical protein
MRYLYLILVGMLFVWLFGASPSHAKTQPFCTEMGALRQLLKDTWKEELAAIGEKENGTLIIITASSQTVTYNGKTSVNGFTVIMQLEGVNGITQGCVIFTGQNFAVIPYGSPS